LDVLLPLTTYALLLTAAVLSMSELVSARTRALLALVGVIQVGLLVSWTFRSDCVGTWCAQSGGLGTWLVGPALLSFALGFAAAEARRHSRA
jgi:hypothetical protein